MFWKISLTDIGDISTWWWKKCSRICGEMFFKLTLHTRTCQTKNTKPPKYIWWKTMVGTGHFLRFIHSWKNMTHINSKVIFFSDNPIICGKENTLHWSLRLFMCFWKIKPGLKTCLGFHGAIHPYTHSIDHRCMRSFMRLWKIKPCLKTCLGFLGAINPYTMCPKCGSHHLEDTQ